jgi:hypothetical protein
VHLGHLLPLYVHFVVLLLVEEMADYTVVVEAVLV